MANSAWAGGTGGGGGGGNGYEGDVYTYYDPGKPLDTPGTEDDHFDNDSIDAKWHTFHTDANVTHTESDHHFNIVHTQGDSGVVRLRGRFQDVAASDFTVAMKLSMTAPTINSMVAGLCLFEDATNNPNTCNIIEYHLAYLSAGAAHCYIGATHFSDWSTSIGAIHTEDAATWPTSLYLRIRQNSTTLYYDYSTDGIGWIEAHSAARPWAPAEVGFCTRNSSTSTGTLRAHIDWFRYIASDQPGLIGGVWSIGA
jgi:hypothetical protein